MTLTQSIKIPFPAALPEEIPLVLVKGAILMPKAQLPLPLFDHIPFPLMGAGGEGQKMIGLIQPNCSLKEAIDLEHLNLYSIGTLARIQEINEFSDQRMVVTLEGICRFRLLDKYETEEGYPMAKVCYNDFTGDLVEENDFPLDREGLLEKLKLYFGRLDIQINLEEINKVSNQKLIAALTMACPFQPSEKQVLLETLNLKDQSGIITTLMDMTPSLPCEGLITYH